MGCLFFEKFKSKTIKLLPLQYSVFRIIARAAAEFNDDLAGFTICAAENCNEKRMLPIIYKDTFWLWTPQKQMAVRLAGHYWVGKGRRRRKLCLFFSETPNEITKTSVFDFCKSPNRIEMHKKCQKGIDFMVDMLYSEDAKTIKGRKTQTKRSKPNT